MPIFGRDFQIFSNPKYIYKDSLFLVLHLVGLFDLLFLSLFQAIDLPYPFVV